MSQARLVKCISCDGFDRRTNWCAFRGKVEHTPAAERPCKCFINKNKEK